MQKRIIFALIFVMLLVSCGTAAPTSARPAGYGQNIKDQPAFPPLVENWVVDNGCNFSQAAKENAFHVFDKLDKDHIAQVAVICQTAIAGGYSSASTWISEWLNHVGLGNMIDKRAVAILIRPDVKPEEYRVLINPNDALYWLTSSDEDPINQEAADYANYNDFEGALNSLVKNIDLVLRANWKIYGPK